MPRILSTYVYVDQLLTHDILAAISRSGIEGIEIFCSLRHFNYHEPRILRDMADWLADNRLQLHALHAPTERDLSAGRRESGLPISICDPERVRRLDAVDEVKRALEVAEHIPFHYLIQHLGHGRQSMDPRKFDAAFSSLEHLVVFAKQRGVVIALENTPGELTSPSGLRQFIHETRLDLRLCFDAGHAHLEDGIEAGFEMMRELAVSTHIHDNHGERDEHLLPFEGTINWDVALEAIAGAAQPLPLVLELKEQGPGAPALDRIAEAFDKLEKGLAKRTPNRSTAND